eukprot:tig00000823_g4551.t1
MSGESSRRVCVVPAGVLDEPKDAAVLSLPNPKTDTPHSYLVVGGRVLEAVRATEHASWLLDDESCISDGSLHLWTPCDPIFLILPFLLKSASQGERSERRVFCSLDDVASALGERYEPSARRLVELLRESSEFDITAICDRRDVCGEVAFSLNQERLLSWLCCKVEAIQQQMYKPRPGDEENESLKSAVRAYSIGLLSEYLPRSLHERLLAHFGVDEAAAVKAAAEAMQAAAPVARDSAPAKAEAVKVSGGAPAQGPDEGPRPLPQSQLATASKSAGVKKLAKADVRGMKKMESFFTKAAPKPAPAPAPAAE